MRVLGLGAQTTDMGGTKQVIYFGLRFKILKNWSRSPCQNIPIIRYKKHIIVRFPLVKLRRRPSWKSMSHSKYIQGGNPIAIKSITLLLVWKMKSELELPLPVFDTFYAVIMSSSSPNWIGADIRLGVTLSVCLSVCLSVRHKLV